MNRYLRQILLLAALMLLGFIIYVGLFWIGGRSFSSILFYRGLVLALIAAMITGGIALIVGKRIDDPSLAIAAAAVSLSFNICFLVLLPVTVDRSVSVYLLASVASEQGEGIRPSDLERRFIEDYVLKMRAIDRRIQEQEASGNIQIGDNGRVRLSPQGQRFIALSRVVSRIFHTDPRFVETPGEPTAPHLQTIAGPNRR